MLEAARPVLRASQPARVVALPWSWASPGSWDPTGKPALGGSVVPAPRRGCWLRQRKPGPQKDKFQSQEGLERPAGGAASEPTTMFSA